MTPRPALPGGVAGFSENHRTFFPFLSLILAQTEGFSPSPISYVTSEHANLQSFLQQTLVWPSRGCMEAGRGNPPCVYVNPVCINELRSGSAPDASPFSEIVPLASRRRKRPGTLGTVLRPGQGTVPGGGTAWGLSRSTKTIVKRKRRKREREVSLFDRRSGVGGVCCCVRAGFLRLQDGGGRALGVLHGWRAGLARSAPPSGETPHGLDRGHDSGRACLSRRACNSRFPEGPPSAPKQEHQILGAARAPSHIKKQQQNSTLLHGAEVFLRGAAPPCPGASA